MIKKVEELKLLKNKLIEFGDTLNLPEDITFGLEVEIENIQLEEIEKIIGEFKISDVSFEGYKSHPEGTNLSFRKGEIINGEISTSILRDKKNDWENFNKILNRLKEEKAIITENCSSHVNIGAHIFGKNELYWKNFLLLWRLYEEEIYQFSTGEYKKIRGLYFNAPLKDNLTTNITLNSNEDAKEFFNSFPKCLLGEKNTCYKGFTLRKCNNFEFKENNVIEFRTPNGTLDLNIYKNYVNFFVRFLLACKQDLDIEKIIYKIQTNDHNAIELANLVFSNEQEKNNFLIQTYGTNKIYKKKLKGHIYSI